MRLPRFTAEWTNNINIYLLIRAYKSFFIHQSLIFTTTLGIGWNHPHFIEEQAGLIEVKRSVRVLSVRKGWNWTWIRSFSSKTRHFPLVHIYKRGIWELQVLFRCRSQTFTCQPYMPSNRESRTCPEVLYSYHGLPGTSWFMPVFLASSKIVPHFTKVFQFRWWIIWLLYYKPSLVWSSFVGFIWLSHWTFQYQILPMFFI